MILDKRTEFADAVSVAATASTINVGNIIDLGANHRDIGKGKPPTYLVITVDTEIITGGSAGTIQFLLVSDATDTIATDGSATVHFASKAFVTDDSAANDAQMNIGGVPVCVALPSEGPVYERYLAVQAVIGTTTTTAGKVNAFLTMDPTPWLAYKSGLQ
jgi:hypothetical protein